MSDLLKSFIKVRPMDEETWRKTEALAAKRGAQIAYPSHVVEKVVDGEIQIVGFLSIFHVPIVDLWFDSEQVTTTDSLQAMNIAENLCALQGAKSIVVPVDPKSEFHKHMEALGFRFMREADFYLKDL